MTKKLQADGGVVVTASHNPGEYNGIKFLQPMGAALKAVQAERLKKIWEARQFSELPPEVRGELRTSDATHDAHVEAVCDIVDVEAIRAAKFKVVLDSINGAGCCVTPMLLDKLGCDLVHINGEPNGQFAHKPEPVAENLTGLCDAAGKNLAHVGFAQDPDADRLAVVDENGRFVGEECTLALATAFVLRHRKGKIAANMVTSRMIDDIASAAGCNVVRAPTGEANVVEAILDNGCIFGGEGNGGVIDPRVVLVRDSLVAIAMILQYMAETNRPISELVDELPQYVMLKTKIPCPADKVDSAIQAARQAFSGYEGAAFNNMDGLRIDLAEGWVSVRASNTEPIMRITAEAGDRSTAEEMLDKLTKAAAVS